ncbi:MAG: alpha-mannosidase [Phycisphaerales bacterium]
MPTEHRVQAERIRSWTRYVVDPAVIRHRQPLEARAWPTADRQAIGAADAALAAGAFEPVSPGHRWGPVWSTCWFHLRAAAEAIDPAAPAPAAPAASAAPAGLAGDTWAVRFSSGTEAMWWAGTPGDRQPRHGFDSNRDMAWLAPGEAAPDVAAGLLVEAACNHWFGIGAFAWDPPESQRRWQSDTPGTFEYAELVRVDTAAWRLRERARFACDLLESLGASDIRGRRLREVMADLTRAGNEAAASGGAAELVAQLDAALAAIEPGQARTRGIVVGHAHIDTAWLWPMQETRRKLQRTFSNVLSLMERRPELRFTATSAGHYAWIREDVPPIFERVRSRVAEGRWEPVGAAWIEFDANLPTGESMIRQILHGTEWFRDAFGPDLPQRVLFLPDTFGFPGSLPQIMRATGLDVFVSNKLAWNRRTEFPHPTFRWRGIDGSEVTAHMTPGGDYNARLSVNELQKAEHRLATGAGGLVPVWLQPFGYGDGGGGPDEAMLERADMAGRLPALPELAPGTIHEFADELEAAIAARPADGPHAVPTWDGGLPLELHRGTFTTHGRLKRAMRRAEAGLRRVEWLLAGLSMVDGRAATVSAEGGASAESAASIASAADATLGAAHISEDAIAAALPERWRAVLLNQFHDILPGTSIEIVGRESLAAMESEVAWTEAATAALQAAWIEASDMAVADGPARGATAASPGPGDASASETALVVFNEHAHAISGVVQHGRELAWAGNVPGLGAALIAGPEDASGLASTPTPTPTPTPAPTPTPTPVTGYVESNGHVVLDNGHLRAVIGPAGRVHALIHGASGRDARAAGAEPLNRLELFEDHPHEWDAWELDPEVVEHPVAIDEGPDAAPQPPVVDPSGLRVTTTVEVSLGSAGTVQLTIGLDAGSPRLDVRASIEWTADKRWLRVAHDVDVRTTHAEIEVPFGAERVPTSRRTETERMGFEVCGHRWISLSETGFGVAMLNDGRFGHAAEGQRMSLSLLRAPRHPDPTMDTGHHEVSWAIVPFSGSRAEAGIAGLAAAFNAPLQCRAVRLPPSPGAPATTSSPSTSSSRSSSPSPSATTPSLIAAANRQPLHVSAGGSASIEVVAYVPQATLPGAQRPSGSRRDRSSEGSIGARHLGVGGSDATVLRVVENGGGRGTVTVQPTATGWTVSPCGVDGGPLRSDEMAVATSTATPGGGLNAPLGPWQIRSFLIERVD